MQILGVAEQIQFTEDVEQALREQSLQGLELELSAKLEHYTTVEPSAHQPSTTGTLDPRTVQINYLLMNTQITLQLFKAQKRTQTIIQLIWS